MFTMWSTTPRPRPRPRAGAHAHDFGRDTALCAHGVEQRRQGVEAPRSLSTHSSSWRRGPLGAKQVAGGNPPRDGRTGAYPGATLPLVEHPHASQQLPRGGGVLYASRQLRGVGCGCQTRKVNVTSVCVNF